LQQGLESVSVASKFFSEEVPMGVNKVMLLGNLGRDPEVRYTQNQLPIATLNLATGERRKDASGNWVNHTEWHRVVCFGKLAELASNHLQKGRQVFVEGKIRTNKWKDKEDKDRYTTEIVANSIEFVGGRQSGESGFAGNGGGASSSPAPTFDDVPQDVPFDDDDIPF